MRLPDVVGVLGALAVGALVIVVVLANAVSAPPPLPTPVAPTLPPLPTLRVTAAPTDGPPTDAPSPGPSPTAEQGVGLGQRAPAIEVILLDGSLLNTADFAGKPLWVNFMATWCPQCIDELPMMERFEVQLGDAMTVLVVDVGEDRRTVNAFVRELNVDLTVGLDEERVVQDEWGAYALPVHFWIDGEGIVREIVFGGAPPEIFIEAITTVVPEFSAEE